MVEYDHKKSNSTNDPARVKSPVAADLRQTHDMFIDDHFIVGACEKEKHFKRI